MRKPFLTLLLLITGFLSCWGGPVSLDKAQQTAARFMGTNTQKLKLLPAPSTKAAVSDPSYYIFNQDGGGFVIVSGDDASEPILGYSDTGSFQAEGMPENLKYWVGLWEEQINYIRTEQIQPSEEIQKKWTSEKRTTGDSEVLLKTAKWNQFEPYNLVCKEKIGDFAITGCVATAAAIVMRYHQWPPKGVGTTPAYAYYDYNGEVMNVAANKLGRTYDYKNMPLEYKDGQYTEEQAMAVAHLMFDAGTAFKMMYYTRGNGSGAYTSEISKGLANHFRYSKEARTFSWSEYTDRDWNALLKEEIKNVGPVIYGASDPDAGGHEFVLDGYDSANFFHVNWGWGGISDGYYLISRLNPDYNFTEGHEAVLGLKPDKKGTSKPSDYLSMYPSGDFQGITTDSEQIRKDEPFNLRVGIVYNANNNAPFTGEIAVGHFDKDDNLKSIVTDCYDVEDLEYYNGYYFKFTDCLIKEDIEPGDRLRPYYKGEYGEGYVGSDATCYAYLMLSYEDHTPEEIAKATTFDYSEPYNDITIQCRYPAIFTITTKDGSVADDRDIHFSNGVNFPLGKLKGEELTISIQCGKGTYQFTVKP